MQRKPRFIPEVREVEEVLMLPIDGFDAARDKMELTRNGQSTEAPCFRFGEVVVWGATAMMTAEFLKIWSEVRQLPGEGV
jgi:uncharacterized Rmd1/YagE family protein